MNCTNTTKDHCLSIPHKTPGVIIDKRLTWPNHVNNITSKHIFLTEESNFLLNIRKNYHQKRQVLWQYEFKIHCMKTFTVTMKSCN